MPDGQKWTTYFIYFFILSSIYFTVYRGGGVSNSLITEKTILFQGSKGSNIFQGGGVLIIISKEAHITCDFPGGWGAGPPIPPLDPHMQKLQFRSVYSSGAHLL